MKRLLSLHYLVLAALFLQGLWHGYHGFGMTTLGLTLWCWANASFTVYWMRRGV